MLADLLALVDGMVRDESGRLTADDRSRAAQLALARYSSDRPREIVEDVISTGGGELPLPDAWQAESELVSAEYPIGQLPLSQLAVSIYMTPSGQVLRTGGAVSAGSSVRLVFSVPHRIDDAVDTVPLRHREAVAAYAAALLLEQLAAASINDGDSSIVADTTDRRTKAQEYASRARSLKTRYSESVGLGRDGATPAGGGTTAVWPSRQRLTSGIRRG